MDAFNDNIEKIRRLKGSIFDLRLKYDALKNEALRSDLKDIIQIADKIYAELLRNSDKTQAARRLINYYLPTIDKILGKYIALAENGVKSDSGIKLGEKTEKTMRELNGALSRYYESMFSSEITDIEIETEVLLRQIQNG